MKETRKREIAYWMRVLGTGKEITRLALEACEKAEGKRRRNPLGLTRIENQP